MLGCVLYSLCFGRHPFQEAQTLAIINAHYQLFPSETLVSPKLCDLIRLMLTPNPEKRPTIWELEVILESFSSLESIPLSDEAKEIKRRQEEQERVRNGIRLPSKSQKEEKKQEMLP